MNSVFISGTDTDVGKTYVTAGLAGAMRKEGIDVGIMKPFAAGAQETTGYKSKDVQILTKAACVQDEEELVNPYFFPIPASPYTAVQNLGMKVEIDYVLKNFEKLKKIHDVLLVEGMGGIMTPILENYFITNLIKDMKLDTILISSSRIGTVNHTLMTCKMCENFGVSIRGIIINDLDSNGYPLKELKRDFESLRPKFGWFPLEVVKNTFKVTTQYGRIPQSEILTKRFKSPNPALNVHRRSEPVATDTVYADVPAIDPGGRTGRTGRPARASHGADLQSGSPRH